MDTRRRERGAAPSPAPAAKLSPFAEGVLRHEKALRRCRKRFSAKSVHKMRIETRRLLAQLELLRSLIPGRTFRKAQRGLKRLLRASTFLRDAQVQMLQVSGLLPKRPELRPLYRQLEKNEQRLRRLAKKELKGGAKLLKRLRAIERDAAPDLCVSSATQRYRAAVRLALRHAAVRLAPFRRSPPIDSEGIHRLRVALKKFRYMAESLPKELSVLTPDEIGLLRTHLDHSGEIHDLELLIARLRRIAKRDTSEQRQYAPVWRSLRRGLSAKMRAWRRQTDDLAKSLDAVLRADARLEQQTERLPAP